MRVRYLKARLQREIKASPKKAAILGLLCLVALYFWVPLLWGWASGGPDRDNMSAEDKAIVAVPPRPGPRTTGALRKPPSLRADPEADENTRVAWDRLVASIEEDPRTSPAPGSSVGRDPFVRSQQEHDRQVALETSASVGAVQVTPEALGLRLTATLVGPRAKTAVIGGEPYRMHETIKIAKDGQSFVFTLVEVRPRRVLLEREGQRFELAVVEPATTGRIGLLASPD